MKSFRPPFSKSDRGPGQRPAITAFHLLANNGTFLCSGGVKEKYGNGLLNATFHEQPNPNACRGGIFASKFILPHAMRKERF
jgi:hypothetical protein